MSHIAYYYGEKKPGLMAEACGLGRSGVNSGSVGNCHNFAAWDKDGKEGDTEHFSYCLRPREHCSVAAVCMGARGEE